MAQANPTPVGHRRSIQPTVSKDKWPGSVWGIKQRWQILSLKLFSYTFNFVCTVEAAQNRKKKQKRKLN